MGVFGWNYEQVYLIQQFTQFFTTHFSQFNAKAFVYGIIKKYLQPFILCIDAISSLLTRVRFLSLSHTIRTVQSL